MSRKTKNTRDKRQRSGGVGEETDKKRTGRETRVLKRKEKGKKKGK